MAIAALTSLVMVVFMGSYHTGAGIFAFGAYLIVGVFIPLWNGRRGGNAGMEFRTKFGELNSFVLDSLRGLDETIQYGQGKIREAQMEEKSEELTIKQKKAKPYGRRTEIRHKSGDPSGILWDAVFSLNLYGKDAMGLTE